MERYIGPAIRRLDNLLRREINKSAVKQQIDNLTGLHGWVIRYIAEQESPVFQRDLEKRFSCRRSTMSNVISLMEKNGLIERKKAESDARLRQLVLTPRALDINECARADMLMFEEKIRAGIAEEELSVFFSVIQKIRNNLEGKDIDD